MAKQPLKAIAAEVDAAAVSTEIPLSLDEFCTRLSLTEKRYVLITGFWTKETSAGRVRDIPSAYEKRYAEFLETPLI